MNELAKNEDVYGVKDIKGKAVASSLKVAEIFNKEHFHVLRDIEKIIDEDSGLSQQFRESNFGLSYYKNSQNKKQPMYNISKDGFTILVMGYKVSSLKMA